MKKPSKVEDVMDRVFLTFDPETSVRAAVTILRKEKLFGACVKDRSGVVLGIVSEKECLKLYKDAILGKISKEELNKMPVTKVMYSEFKTVPKCMGLIDAAQIFLSTVHRRLPVVENGRLIGQITRRDIVRAIGEFVR